MSEKTFNISILSGDGIGPEVMDQAIKVLESVCGRYDFNLSLDHQLVGGIAIDEKSTPLPDETLKSCEHSDAILFGSVGGPKWESLPPDQQPERGALLPLRKHFGLFANLLPSLCFPSLVGASPIRGDIIEGGFDVLCVRELTGGIYFGEPKSLGDINGEKTAIDTMIYKESEIERIAHVAFNAAMGRSKRITSIDKANVLRNGILWREIVEKVSLQYPDVKLDHLYVDNAAMQLIRRPKEFDVILAPNGGHGFDSVRELGAYRLMFASKLETTSAFVDFPNDLTYRRVGLVLNPTDYNTTTVCSQNTRSAVKALIFPQSGAGTPSGNFVAGETITQTSTNAKGLVVSYDSTTKVLKYYQDVTDGTVNGNVIAFSGANQITGSTNSYTATPDAAFGTSSVPLTQITIGVSVYELGLSFVTGYANEEIELNSGEILYLDNRIPITRSADQNEELKVVIEF